MLQLFECGHFFCDACALAVFKERSRAPCPTCRADVHASKIFQGSASLSAADSLRSWERPELAQVSIPWAFLDGHASLEDWHACQQDIKPRPASVLQAACTEGLELVQASPPWVPVLLHMLDGRARTPLKAFQGLLSLSTAGSLCS